MVSDNILGGESGTHFQFIIVDDTKLTMAKAKQYALEHKGDFRHFILIKPENKEVLESSDFNERIEAIRNWLFNPTLVFTSDIIYNKPDVVSSNRSTKPLVSGQTFQSSGNKDSWYVRSTKIDMEAGGVYVYTPGGSRVCFGSKATADSNALPNVTQYRVMEFLATIYNRTVDNQNDKIKCGDIVGVTASDIKKFDTDPDWVNLFDVVQPEAVKMLPDAITLTNERITIGRILHEYLYTGYRYEGSELNPARELISLLVPHNIDNNYAFFKDNPHLETTTLGKLVNTLTEMTIRANQLETYSNVDFLDAVRTLAGESEFSYSDEDENFITKLSDEDLVKIQQEYPMLKIVDSISTSDLNNIINYVNMIEKSKEELK